MAKFQLLTFSVVGFTGCRKVVPVKQLDQAISRVNPSAAIAVGCASGVDAAVRMRFDDYELFEARNYGQLSTPHAAKLALRSTAMVKWVAKEGGAMVGFPSKSCPEGLRPRKSWPSGYKSGTWSTIALAIGLGVSTLIWSPSGQVPDWGFEDLGMGWFVWQSPVEEQRKLF